MRFGCQSCGKAYNLPEERIADKSNVKLKCRVCGAIVEVKRQGELVAIVLDESEDKRSRVSEAPAPLTTLTPEDDAEDGATISISEAVLNDRGALQPGLPVGSLQLASLAGAPPMASPVGSAQLGSSVGSAQLGSSVGSAQLGLSAGSVPLPVTLQMGSVPLPPAPPTGFSSSSLSPPPLVTRPELGSSRLEAGAAPPLPSPFPPLSPPPPPPLAMDIPAQAMVNGSNGASEHFSAPANAAEFAGALEERSDAASPIVSNLPNAATTSGMATLPEELPPLERDDTTKKMLAAFLTGVLVDRLIAGLFF
jgi:hypothetical protein